MASEEKQYPPESEIALTTVPFDTVEEAWFWFIQAQQARNDGARFVMGAGLFPRPCEPTDILRIVDRLYRKRRLLMDHILVLRHYGRRMLPPDPHRIKEGRAYSLWKEALARIEPVLESKGIISRKSILREAAECQSS